MTVTALDISSLRGTNLPLDSRRRDALATYARFAAEDAGMAPQAWVRKTWGFVDYEAKALLRCDASEAMWERILKHPNGGWKVAIPVLGSVIGLPIHEFFRDQTRLAALEARRAEEHERLAQIAYRRLADDPADSGAPREDGPLAGEVGAEAPRRLAQDATHLRSRSFAPPRR